MIPWFLREPGRLTEERAGIDDLLHRALWLLGAEWRFDPDLCVDVVIRAHEFDYNFRVNFPSFYPEVPAAVCPRNLEHRLSQHQYGGADGPLCLEWGPDNWHRGVTAATLLESTYRLLDIENPLGRDRSQEAVIAPSRHHLEFGQQLRSTTFRWYYSRSLEEDFLAAHPAQSAGSFRFSFRDLGECWIVLLHEARTLEGNPWIDPQIPQVLPGAAINERYSGVWVTTDLDGVTLDGLNNLDELRRLLEPLGVSGLLATDGSSSVEGFDRYIAGILIVDSSHTSHFFVVLSRNGLTRCSVVRSQQNVSQQRIPDSANLRGLSVGLAGSGSAGSKIAITLARMGVNSFYLVDHDVLLPENLVRHALDWQHIARHKAEAVAATIRSIDPSAVVRVSLIHLTGQESNAVIAGVARCLGECDLIIDATARPRVFNLLAAIARIAFKPLVWFEVFGGGVGGLIARSRPGIDPSPQAMRAAYLGYCEDHPAPPGLVASEDYTGRVRDDEVLAASDADVSIIAYHAARLASDSFASVREPQYPHSMYLVGLTRAWVFREPFDTIPIAMTPAHETPSEPEMGQDNLDFLVNLLPRRENEPPPTA